VKHDLGNLLLHVEIAIRVHEASQLNEGTQIAIFTSMARGERKTLDNMATPCSVKA
jgi:hypothetical protein